MKDFFKILAITMTVFFIMAGACAYSVYKSHKNFPEYAKKEFLYEKYKDYLNSIDQELASSTSLLDFAAKIEKLEHPEEVIYLCLEKESDFDNHSNDNDEIEIIKKFESGSKSTYTSNGTGYGRINGQNIVIIKHDVSSQKGLETCVIYFKHESESK
ncbi:hypothetical protein LNTAR_06129 [Lentisphaera araneosa HTCC2155]|jgi:hypothetical protein|uniref:Lipoprotein n=1 Tax=Lentisphaera araneosa HTCC2155 TaxID=313628 RepID=A6DN52_9BACT|nr:hypothetical protein [Lentisphaera araneosa]EDM26800.1 hypothetical protein LNTAR_06129 [Lentisphaera araneosa HTCC2155]